jgi:hypothetical protein
MAGPNTFDVVTLTLQLEIESVSIKSFFQRKKWKRGLGSTIEGQPHSRFIRLFRIHNPAHSDGAEQGNKL